MKMKFLICEKNEKTYIEKDYIILQKVCLARFMVRQFNSHIIYINTCEYGYKIWMCI